MNGTWKLTIYSTDDKYFDVNNAEYECDGLMLIVNRGEEQFVFNMDYVKWFKAELESEEEDATNRC